MKLLDLINENKNISYSAAVLTPASRSEILSKISIPEGWKTICHHMTIKMGELPDHLKSRLNDKVSLTITAQGQSDKALALKISTDLSQNAIPHITVAINANAGAKPKDSNYITEWKDMEPFTVEAIIQEIANQPKYTVLNVFDFDGTLMDSPLPDEGKKLYKQLTGKEYPHKGWWGQLDSLEPFKVKPIEKTAELYKKYANIPNSLNVLMTNRLGKFEKVIKDKLEGIYKFDMYNFSTDQREKPERIEEILKNNPSIRTINIFDDMDIQIAKFEEFKQNNPELDINITQIK